MMVRKFLSVRDSIRWLLSCCLLLALFACSSAPKTPTANKPSTTKTEVKSVNKPAEVASSSASRGGYYQDDGPGDNIPANLETTPDPVPTVEPFSRTGNKPYQVFGKTYTPLNDTTTPFKQRGIASWYGKKFHGKRTSSGEPYDMFKITAAHPILPIPSYARVTNLANGKQIIVRVNDRGPFHSNRVMDLSYTAALKLGYLGKGSSEIEIERLLPDEIARMAENRRNQIAQTEQTPEENLQAARGAVERERALRTGEAKKKVEESRDPRSAVVNSGVTSNVDTANKSTAPIYLQFAAFGIRANAEASRDQMLKKLGEQFSSLDISVEIIEQGHLYRVQAGPFANRADAQTVLDKIANVVGKALLVQR